MSILIKKEHTLEMCNKGVHLKKDECIGIYPRQPIGDSKQTAMAYWYCPVCDFDFIKKGVDDLTDSEVTLFNELIKEAETYVEPPEGIIIPNQKHYRFS